MQARRYDRASIGKNVRRDSRGFVEIPSAPTRVGVFPYRRADGSTVRELRHPDQVFRADSLATLRSAPVTVGHPAQFVDASNARELEVGVVDEPRQDGRFVAATVSIRRADAIAKIDARELVEMSCGYSCDIDPTPGEYEGERYDQAQTNIVYNHVALGPRGWGRAGGDVGLRLDAGDAVSEDAAMHAHEDSSGAAGEGNSMKKIRIDGVDYDVPEQTAAALAKDAERRDAAEAVLKDKAESERKRADTAEAERDQAKAQLAVASDPAKRADAIKARVELERNAAKVLGDAERFDSLDDRKVREKVLAKLSPSVKLDGKSDEYVTAAYEVALASAPARNDGLSLLGAAIKTGEQTGEREDGDDLDAAFNKRRSAFNGGK